MGGVSGHISKRMRAGLVDALQELLEESLGQRAEIAHRVAVHPKGGVCATTRPRLAHSAANRRL